MGMIKVKVSADRYLEIYAIEHHKQFIKDLGESLKDKQEQFKFQQLLDEYDKINKRLSFEAHPIGGYDKACYESAEAFCKFAQLQVEIMQNRWAQGEMKRYETMRDELVKAGK